MPMTDPIADMLTRIRNATRVQKKSVTMPASTVKQGIARVLKEEGFIGDFRVEPGQPTARLVLDLKYGETGELVIRSIERVSKPGCRVYSSADDLRPIVRGLGIQILSTPKGIVSDRVARRDRVGGEVLCKVY
ncbi:MAG: 30S ribosomal protein S8 [Planctomycetes bacterium]|nr:30S ribosomal protein S8 [Planctomycetota bacterium]